MNKILLDTNFLIYAIDEDSKYFKAAHELLSNKTKIFFTTSKNLSEFLSVITRYPNSLISIKEALSLIDSFRENFIILYPSENSYNIFIELLKKYNPCGLTIHDFEIVSIALSEDIKNIATFNRKDFERIEEIQLIGF